MSPRTTPAQFEPFETLLRNIHDQRITSWAEIELDFLDATSAFDTLYATGKKDKGWYQAKARYFNDVLVALISSAVDQPVRARSKKRSILFEKIDIDLCYPEIGDPVVCGEAKQLGAPPHPGNNLTGRPANQDIHKRVREVALTSMDIKAAHTGPRQIESFGHWVSTATPAYISFWALRADTPQDLDSCRSILYSLRNYCNQVGAFVYEPTTGATDYTVKHFRELSMDTALNEFVQRSVSAASR